MSDTDFPFDPDDPRVTAYALDEMQDAGARAGFEQILARSPEARAMVEEIRALSGQLIAEYDEERRLAQAEPSNVIPMPMAAPRWASWAGQLLRIAAMLAVLGIAGAVFAPYFRGPQAVKLNPVMADARINSGALTVQKRPAGTLKSTNGLREPASVARSGVASQIAIPYDSVNAPAPSFAFSVEGKMDTEKERAVAVSDAKKAESIGSLAQAAPAAIDQSAAALKPVVQGDMPALEAAPPAQPAADTVAGNALGGGRVAVTAAASAKDAFFQNRLISGNDGADAGARVNLQRLETGSGQMHAAGTVTITASADFVSPADAPLSSFAIAWNNGREKSLQAQTRARSLAPPPVAGTTLRDFPFADASPAPGDAQPLAVRVESASCPWSPAHRLVRVAFKGHDLEPDLEKTAADNGRRVVVKFNPAEVSAYRLVGGVPPAIELNAWQEATLLYEVVPAGQEEEAKARPMDRLPVDRPVQQNAGGLVTVAVQPDVVAGELRDTADKFAVDEDASGASADFKFAAAVAAYDLAVQARRDKNGAANLDLAIQLAQEGLGKDPGGYRAAFLKMLQTLRNAQTGR